MPPVALKALLMACATRGMRSSRSQAVDSADSGFIPAYPWTGTTATCHSQGLKTALLRTPDQVMEGNRLRADAHRDLCAGFQAPNFDVLVEKTRRAVILYMKERPVHPCLSIAGGLTANQAIRVGLDTLCAESGIGFVAPPPALCTDNRGDDYLRVESGASYPTLYEDDMTLTARPHFPLEPTQAGILGIGKKGPKA